MRFQSYYEGIRDAENPLQEIRSLSDEEVIAALAAATEDRNPYLGNVLATEAMNRARRMNTLTRALGDGVVILDAGGRITNLNPAAEKHLGRALREAHGLAFRELRAQPVPPGRDPLERVLHGSDTEHWDHEELRSMDGTSFPASITASPILQEGDVTGAIVVFRDITQRKRVEAELASRAAAMEAAMDGMAILDAHEAYVHVNPAHARIYGYDDPSEMVGLTWHHLYEPETRRQLAEEAIPQVDSKGSWRGECVGRRRNGETFPQELTLSRIKNNGLVCVVRDITEQKEAARRREEREQLYRSLFDHSPDAVYQLDRQGRFLAANPAVETLSGRTPEELTGQSFVPLVVPEDRDRAWQEFERCLDGEARRVNLTITRANGERRELSVAKIPVIVHGQVVGVFGIAKDETARRQAERILRQNHRDLEHILDALADELEEGVLLIDDEGLILFANRAAEQMTGLSRESVVGARAEDRVRSIRTLDGEPVPQEDWPLKKALRTGHPVRGGKVLVEYVNGQTLPLTVNAVPLQDAEGRVRRVVASFTDLRPVEHREEKIRHLNQDLERRVRQLEAAYEELDAFSYSASHDLRAPLRAITYLGQALEEDFGDELPPEGQEYLERMRREASRMTALVNDLLRLSRVSRAEIRKSDVDLSDLAAEIMTDLRGRDPGREAEIHIQEDVHANGDRHLLRIALENLLGNAWKYTAKRDRSRIDFGKASTSRGEAYFVRDNGVGFDPDQASKLFQPFQRLHAPTEYPGTGIGLATVKRIVERHGGEVWAEGHTGEGATFWFTL